MKTFKKTCGGLLKDEYIDKLNAIWDEISTISNPNRIRILYFLFNQEEANVKEIHEKVNLSYPTISNNFKVLLKEEYVFKHKSYYYVGASGKIKLQLLFKLTDIFNIADNYQYILANHIVDDFSIDNILSFNYLKDSKLMQISRKDVFAIDKLLIDNMKNSKFLYFIFSELNLRYVEIISELLSEHIPVKLIIPQEIRVKFIDSFDRDLINKAFMDKRFYFLATSDKIHLNLFVNDFMMAFNLFHETGIVDKNNVIISNNDLSLKWAKSVFNNCFEKGGIKYGSLAE